MVSEFHERDIETYSYWILALGLFFAVSVFMMALAWDTTIVDTIAFISERLGFDNDPSIKINVPRFVLNWGYTLGLTALVLFLLYVFREHVPPEFLVT